MATVAAARRAVRREIALLPISFAFIAPKNERSRMESIIKGGYCVKLRPEERRFLFFRTSTHSRPEPCFIS